MLTQKFKTSEIPINVIDDPFLSEMDISVSILRCDLIHPELSGNKWFKLKYNLQAAKEQGHTTILSFGGAWSNHIHALSAAGKYFGFKTIGIIRGEKGEELNPCLQDAVNNGMELHWLSREDYRQKETDTIRDLLKEKIGNYFLVPEGGSNLLGIKGCSEILNHIELADYDLVSLACGTGATLTGIISAKSPKILGFQVLKGQGYLSAEVHESLRHYQIEPKNEWLINEDYHFGGYGKTGPVLHSFIEDFQLKTAIPLEPVYSGKMLYGIYDLCKKNYFKKGTRILVIHGGGLQGARGF